MEVSNIFPVKKVENVELLLDGIRTQYKFGDIENLRGKKIKIVEFFRVGDVPVSPTGNVLVADNIFSKAFLVLTVDGKEVINRIPLTVLNSKDNQGRRVLFKDLLVNWPKSYVEIGNTAAVVVGTTFFLNVYYEDNVPAPAKK